MNLSLHLIFTKPMLSPMMIVWLKPIGKLREISHFFAHGVTRWKTEALVAIQ